MSPVWYLVVVIAVLAVAAVVFMLRRSTESSKPSAERPAVKPPAAGDAPKRVEAAARAVQSKVVKEQRRAPAPAETPARSAAPAEPSEPVVAEKVVAKPELSPEELRARVQSSLDDSERLLGKLQAIADEAGSGSRPVDAGMLEIMKEGLEEVRSLAQKKKWSQAKDKGEALHAQLSLMLGSARREPAS